jgi:transcriptional regulator with XRE-family HTH domain
MNVNELSLRKLATILGVSQPFLSQIRAGKRPLPDALKTKVDAPWCLSRAYR